MASEETAARAAQSKADNPITQRLWIGLGGIAAILVTIAMLDIVQKQASNEPPVDGSPAVEQAAQPQVAAPPIASEPLVDLGVVPDLPAEDTPVPPAPLPQQKTQAKSAQPAKR